MNKFIKHLFLILPLLLVSCNKQPTIVYNFEELRKNSIDTYITYSFNNFKKYVLNLNKKNEGFYLVTPQYQYSSKFGSQFTAYRNNENGEIEFIKELIYFDINNLDGKVDHQVYSTCYYFLYDYFLLEITIVKNKFSGIDFEFENGTALKIYEDYDNYTVKYPYINISSNGNCFASVKYRENNSTVKPSIDFIEEYLKNNLFYEYKLINE